MNRGNTKTKKAEQLVRFKLMQMIAANFNGGDSVGLYRDLNKLKINFSMAKMDNPARLNINLPQHELAHSRIEPEYTLSPEMKKNKGSIASKIVQDMSQNTSTPKKVRNNLEAQQTVNVNVNYILKRLNTFNLGKLTNTNDVYDFYSFSDLASTVIKQNWNIATEMMSNVKNSIVINPLMQFINGLTLMAISFLKLPQSKIILTNMMYKLGDNRCVEHLDNGDITQLKNYLREHIFAKNKRKLDVEVFFWVLWSNFKRKL